MCPVARARRTPRRGLVERAPDLFDENGKPYLYSLRVFVKNEHVFLVESGGPKPGVCIGV
jgi:hypothetical protein